MFQWYSKISVIPHMTVEENLGFSLKIAKVEKKEIEERVKNGTYWVARTSKKTFTVIRWSKTKVAMGRAIVRRLMRFYLMNLFKFRCKT